MHTRRIATRGIIFKDGKILAQKLKSKTGVNSFWCMPGGGLDPRESLVDGVRREMIEETGITPKIGRLLFVQQFTSSRPDCDEELEFFFHIENPEDYEVITLHATSHGAIEVAECAFIDPSKDIRPAFLQSIDIASYIDNVKPVYIYNALS